MMVKRIPLTPSVIGLVLAYVILYIWQPGETRVLNLVTDLLTALLALLASCLAYKASRLFEAGTAARRAWLLFSVGLAAMTTAELVWAYYHIVLDQQIPFPSPADILWAMSYIPILISLILQYRALGVQASRRRKLTVAAGCFTVLIIALATSVWPALSRAGQIATMDLLINLYYLLGDLSIAFIAILSLLFLRNGLVSRPWQYMVFSVLLFIIAELAFFYSSANDLYATGRNLISGIVDVVYLSAYVMAAAGGYRQLTLHLAT